MLATLEGHTTAAPNAQATVDIFKGEWSSKLPDGLQSGWADLFDDVRSVWAESLIRFRDKVVLELGPLEGGHVYQILKFGAKEVTSVEAYARAFLKCLIVKEIWHLDRWHILYGDVIQYLAEEPRTFDVVYGSGILYHSMEPLRLLDLICRSTSVCYIWTHYYDDSKVREGLKDDFPSKFPGARVDLTQAGYSCRGYLYNYGAALDWKGFSGGTASTSVWLSRDDILGFLKHRGFNNIETAHEAHITPAGPAFSIVARK